MRKMKFSAFVLAMFISLGCFASCNSSETSSGIHSNSSENTNTVATTKTWATNFAGTISEEADGAVYTNYYLNQNDWLIGENVKFRDSVQEGSDYIRFLNSTNRSLFGPRVRYEDFVCRFTVIMGNIDLAGNGASFGLSFNRKTLYSYANDCPGILFMKADNGTAVRVTQGDMDKAESGTVWLQYQEENAIDLWSEKDAKYDFMVVKSGDEAQVYYAKAGDTESLKILRTTISGVSGEGFVAMSGIMGSTFYLDNFGVWDLNENRENLSEYTQNGSVALSENKAVVNRGGSLLSKNALSNVSVTYDLKLTSGNSFALMLGDSFINFSSDDSVTGSKDIATIKNEAIDFSAFKNGAAVRLRNMGSMVYVDVNNGDGYVTVAIFDTKKVEQMNFGIKAGEDASLIVNSIANVSLAGTVEIATKNYDPIVDLEPIRAKDLSMDEYYGG